MKDETRSHPVAEVWRPRLRQIVQALADGDYELSRGIPSVVLPSKATVDRMREYVADFGETLAALPDQTWERSAAQWMGTHWDVIVDLWTVESGGSDLVLSLQVFEADAGFRFEIDSLYVP